MPLSEPLVDAASLAGALGDPAVVVADVRWYLDGRSGRAVFEEGHVPGAVFVDLDAVLAGPVGDGSRGRHPLPSPDDFASALGDLGIGADAFVVAYDDAGGSIAARLWWMLRAAGQRGAVLDGGTRSWPGPWETGPGEARAAVPRATRPWPASSIAELCATGGPRLDGATRLVDARAPERYRGEVEPVDARAGHIPGAVNLPWSGNLDADTGKFLDAAALRRRFGTGDIVSYCGSGVTACHNLLALEVAGLEGGRLYPGSWSEWSWPGHDRPVAT
jgi:thiosulfate/3-mercaptopyruvate sulfurtransferase